MYYQSNIQFFCINLHFRKTKFEKLRKNFLSENIILNRVEETDGGTLQMNDFKNLLTYNYYTHLYNNKQYLGHLGCSMSHIYLWRYLVVNTTIRYGIILEDDIHISPGFMKKVYMVLEQVTTINHE